jgi:hypothetical protein
MTWGPDGGDCEDGCPHLPRDTRVKVMLVARPLLTPVTESLCRCERVYSRAEGLFILEFVRETAEACRDRNNTEHTAANIGPETLAE